MAKKSIILNDRGEAFQIPQEEIAVSARATFTDIDAVTVSQVLGALETPARSRSEIYRKYLYMLGDPIIGQALNLHVTQALGGHETTGDVLFLEVSPDVSDAEKAIVEEVRADLLDMLNGNVYQMALWACAFGDSYSRIYSKGGVGVSMIEVSDFYMPAFVQPFEKAGRTAGYQISVDDKRDFMTPLQLARLKMPRMGFVPQHRMQYNYYVQSVMEDDEDKQKPIPANIGGSFLEMAEKPFFLLQTALLGLSSGRILDSIRENFFGLNMRNMTKQQQEEFFKHFTDLLKKSKQRANQAVQNNSPVVEKITHVLPVWDEKQLYSINAGGTSDSTANAYTTDDVMMYAKMLAGALGLDLSMLGFSDLLSGGLGDGGFFRVSAQSGQRARLIRQGVTHWVNHIIDVHCHHKYGGIFTQGKRPYEVVFSGATSALERENQETRERKAQASATVIQVLGMLKEQGADEKTAVHFMKEQMGLDEEDAQVYAKMIHATAAEEPEDY